MANFKKVQINAYTREEAVAQAPFQIQFDGTQAWKKAGSPLMGKELDEFCETYLKKKTKMASGVGFSITIDAGVKDTRERPYTIKDIKNELGKRKFKTGIQGINPATGEILFTCFDTKAKAKEIGRDLYTKKDYKGNVHAKYVKEVVEGETGAFDIEYTPSVSTKLGTYLVVGVEA